MSGVTFKWFRCFNKDVFTSVKHLNSNAKDVNILHFVIMILKPVTFGTVWVVMSDGYDSYTNTFNHDT